MNGHFKKCENDDCSNSAPGMGQYCLKCMVAMESQQQRAKTFVRDIQESTDGKLPLSQKYPKYHKQIPPNWKTIDTYGVNELFPVNDPTGCILHARKKLLIPGSRTGGKSMRDDIKESRDTLTRWLELTEPSNQ